MTVRDVTHWHLLTSDEVQQRLGSGPAGLTSAEARRRLEQFGPNELVARQTTSAAKILLDQFRNVLLIILLCATGFSIFVGHGTESLVIGAIVLFAVLLGFVQEYRAERSMEALRRMAAPVATVIRDHHEWQLPARELVPGDLLLLKAGDKIPADGRLVMAANLRVDQAALTGESVPVEKQVARITDASRAMSERDNIVYAGTHVNYGRGSALIFATGMSTEFGCVAELLQSVEATRTPLQDNLDRVGRNLAKLALVIVVLIVLAGLLRQQQSFVEMLIFGIALAVAVVPEALPAVVTVSLAIGVQRMARRNALVRHLPAVETLGSTTIICSDKTGTLTRDEMTVRQVRLDDSTYDVTGSGYEPSGQFVLKGGGPDASDVTPELRRLLLAGVLSSDAHLVQDETDGQWRVLGDPTEGALLAAGAKAGLTKTELDAAYPRVAEIPFSSESKRMTTLHQAGAGVVAFTKGAPEVVVPRCVTRWTAAGMAPLTTADRDEVLRHARTMAGSALRVLALAERHEAALESADAELTLLGLVGMIDPPRAEAQAAVAKCHDAGIRVVMITGDHPLTAMAIARELGIAHAGRLLDGVELEQLDDDQLLRVVDQVEVYARVSPAHKLRVVTALQRCGHVVAMTGDGVNDAPSLRKADIGIAMGITGTDVTKEAAEMMLTDDNFASIVAAVEEGRAIYGNIKKYLMYLLSANIGEIGLMAGASLLGLPMPLSAVQILYVNLATDGLPALALAVDPPAENLMRVPPRAPRHGIFTPATVRLMSLGGFCSALLNLTLFAGARRWGYSDAEAMTMTFVSLVLIEFFKAYSFRSADQHVLRRPLVNRWLNLAIAWEMGLLVMIMYVPALARLFGIQPLSAGEWFGVVVWSHLILPALEFGKWIERRR